jgi:hypothetical protein
MGRMHKRENPGMPCALNVFLLWHLKIPPAKLKSAASLWTLKIFGAQICAFVLLLAVVV